MPREGLQERQESDLMDCGKNEFYRLLYSRGWFFGEDEEDEGKEGKRWKGHSLVELVAANSRTCLKDWMLEVTAMVMELWKEASGDFSMNMAQLRVFTMKSTHCEPAIENPSLLHPCCISSPFCTILLPCLSSSPARLRVISLAVPLPDKF